MPNDIESSCWTQVSPPLDGQVSTVPRPVGSQWPSPAGQLTPALPSQGALVDKILSRKLQAGSPPTWLTSGVHEDWILSSTLPEKVQLNLPFFIFLLRQTWLSLSLSVLTLSPLQKVYGSYPEAPLTWLEVKGKWPQSSPLWRERTNPLTAASKGILMPWLFISTLF